MDKAKKVAAFVIITVVMAAGGAGVEVAGPYYEAFFGDEAYDKTLAQKTIEKDNRERIYWRGLMGAVLGGMTPAAVLALGTFVMRERARTSDESE